MSIQPIPNRCIWCNRRPPEATFNENHVLPECVGNKQQILPAGIVCASCNNYFGSKIEPVLLDDPFFHIIAVVLSLVDPDDMNAFRNRLFDQNHPSDNPVQKSVNVSANIAKNQVSLNVAYEIKGSMSRSYTPGPLSFLSRAIHKVAFECLAYEVFVKGIESPPDLFSPQFEHVRLWAREGQPRSFARPVLRRMPQKLSTEWEFRMWKFEEDIGFEIRMFGDWYGVSLTSLHTETLNHLRKWVGSQTKDVWYISDSMVKLDAP